MSPDAKSSRDDLADWFKFCVTTPAAANKFVPLAPRSEHATDAFEQSLFESETESDDDGYWDDFD